MATMPEQEASPGGAEGRAPADGEAAADRARFGAATRTRSAPSSTSTGRSCMRLALMHVPSRAIAEEVVQDTWLAALNGIDRFEGRSSIRTWLASIAAQQGAHPRPAGAPDPAVLIPAAAPRGGRDEPAVDPDRFQGARRSPGGGRARRRPGRPAGAAGSDETRGCCSKAIADLPPRQREVIALRDISGWPPPRRATHWASARPTRECCFIGHARRCARRWSAFRAEEPLE